MSTDKYAEVAFKYRVEDLYGACSLGSRMSNILGQIESGCPISNTLQGYLFSKGLLALFHYSRKEVSYDEFLEIAEKEQLERRIAGDSGQARDQGECGHIAAERLAASKKEQARIQAEWDRIDAERLARENDPRNIAKAKQFEMRRRYGLSDFIEENDFPKVMELLRKVDRGIRLSDVEVVWLLENGNDTYRKYYTPELKEGYHRNEAAYFDAEFKRNQNPWDAFTASKHYRKCKKAKTADTLLCAIDVTHIKNSKLKSALFTAHGGVKRDLMMFDAAVALGEKAHLLTPREYRPCTLLGAVKIEMGDFEQGQAWYRKAVERGYEENSVDDELRTIFKRLEKSRQQALREHLLQLDPVRYSWAKKNGR